MNVKSGCGNSATNGGRTARLAAQTCQIPFTNIKTCNGRLDAQAEDNRRRRAYETLLPFLRFWLYSYLGLAPAAYCPFQPFLRF